MITQLKDLYQSAKSHTGFRRYFANTSWMFGEQILRMISGLLVGVWVARYLGPEQFGIFSYSLAFVSIFAGIAKLGLDGIIVRDLVNEPEKRNVYLGTAFWLKLFGAFLTLGIMALATLFTSNDYTTNIYIFIIASGVIFQSFEVIDFYFQSKVLSKFVSTCKIIQLLLSSLLKIYFVITGADLLWFVVVAFLDQLALAFTLYIAYKYQKQGGFYQYFDFNVAKKLLIDSWPLIFSGIAISIYMRIDQIMIKEMLGDKEVGLYSAAVKLVEIWYFIPTLITNSLFPSIVNAKKENTALYNKRLQRLYTLMISMALIIGMLMLFLSHQLLGLLYGESFKDAAPVLSILIWGLIPVVIGVVWSSWLLAENHQQFAVISHVTGAILNVIFNCYLIPLYGIIGCAIATLLSYFLSAIFALSLYKGSFTYALILHTYKNEKY